MPATDKQRQQVRMRIAGLKDDAHKREAAAFAAVLADAKAEVLRQRDDAEKLIPGDTIWTCACGERWIEDGEDIHTPVECSKCGQMMTVTGRLSDETPALNVIGRVETFDLIAWSLRLPLLRERARNHSGWVVPPEEREAHTAEQRRLDALITEGERALGILPPEAGDE